MSAEEKVEKRITQHLVDNAFSCLDGFGRLTYALDDCRLIQRFIKEAHGVHLSLSECQRFWKWRSELWDASFLTVQDHDASRKEVLDFFGQWLDEMDLWEWAEVERLPGRLHLPEEIEYERAEEAARLLLEARAESEHLGWIQCTQCGWGCEVHRAEVEAGDYIDRQACPECGLGPCEIDWDYPDGPGWRAEEL